MGSSKAALNPMCGFFSLHKRETFDWKLAWRDGQPLTRGSRIAAPTRQLRHGLP
jgi:hypothetical protein